LTLYAESSAILSWLLDEPSAGAVREIFETAGTIVASDLTLIECDRLLLRAQALAELTEVEVADRRAHLATASAHWHVLRISSDVVARAREPFPGDPSRTLDAIHLACALVARTAVAGLELLSLDSRIRNAGKKLGFGVVPAQIE
jgi:predicted nucleic acid-binding protein